MQSEHLPPPTGTMAQSQSQPDWNALEALAPESEARAQSGADVSGTFSTRVSQ